MPPGAFFFLLGTLSGPGLTHSRFFLWKCFIGSAQREGQHTEQKKKHVQCAFFFFAPRAARAHSLTLLFVEMFYRLGPREKDSTPNKKKTRPVRVFFFAPRAARAHSLTLLFVEMFCRLGPREKDSTPNKKKKTSSARFFFAPRAARAHLLTCSGRRIL